VKSGQIKNIFLIILAATAICSLPYSSWAKDIKKTQSLDDELKFKAGDEEGNEFKALKTEMLISRTDERALQQLKKLLAKYKGKPMEASLNFRLAEIYMRKAKSATFFEIHRDDSNAVKFSPSEVKSANSKAWIKKAIATYDDIEKRFVHYTDMDLVLFNNGFAREMVGLSDTAVQRYKKVIEDYSSSPLVPDCHLSIGEALFNKKQFQASFDELQKIRPYVDSRVYPYGLYKGAWALYNLRRTDEALKQLEEVVAYSKQNQSDGSGPGHLDLSREALDDMVAYYEDVKKPSDAVSYFRAQAGDAKAGEYVLKLGKLYQRHGRFQNMEIVFTQIIGSVPLTAERPQMHRDLMDGFDLLRKRDKVIENLETLASLCDEKSSWALVQSKEGNEACWNGLEEASRVYSSKWHMTFKKYPDNKEALAFGRDARRAYEAVLKSSHSIDGEDKIRFSYAELLFQLKDFLNASSEYSKVSHLTTDAKLKHDSSYAALVSLEKSVGDKWSDKDEASFNLLARDYIQMNPKGAFVTDIKFKKAFIAYDKGRFTEAAPQFKILAEQFITSERGKKAARLYLDILNLQKNFSLLSEESARFVKTLNLDEAMKKEFVTVHRQAEFTVVQNEEVAEKYADAIKNYLKLAEADPGSPFADKALFNAIRCAGMINDFKQAVSLSELMLQKFPQASAKLEVAKNLATLYEAQAQLKQAARTYERLALLEPDKASPDLLLAADYHALDSNWVEAVRIYTSLSQGKNETVKKTALSRLAVISEREKKIDRAQGFYRQISELGLQPEASLAAEKLVEIASENQDDDLAFRLAKKVITMRNEKNASTKALAKARFIQARILEKEFTQSSVKAKPERLSIVLAIKAEKLEHAQKAYQDAIQFGDSETSLASLVRLAKCYESFASALSTIQAPSDAPLADQKKFSQEIENMAFPIAEKNAETLGLALKQAKALNLHDGTVARIQLELNRLSKRTDKNQIIVEINPPSNVLPVVN
jgi:tetratricopeptide (TPR) repeat protein